MSLLGIDLGSSSIKLAIIDSETGKTIGTTQYPETEMEIIASKAGWAEQEPEKWWSYIKTGLAKLGVQHNLKSIKAIGITYQMHGLVCVDKNKEVLRPSIIWCDSRAVEIGNKAFKEIGENVCLENLLNSPGNFTASKLSWVKQNEPELFDKIDKIMLPGDFIAMKLTGEINTTITGLSEGTFWDYTKHQPADFLLNYYGIPQNMIPETKLVFEEQCGVIPSIANELGLKPGTPIAYRAGDQPNNAFSLNVNEPGEIAATGGTSGVVYAVSDQQKYDPESRVNIFAHVNHTNTLSRYGVLLCINGTGILNSWLNKFSGNKQYSYDEMNAMARNANIGSEGLTIIPFGNGAERVLRNKETGAQIGNINFNIHSHDHIFRAAQEGIAFSFMYGINLMQKYNGVKLKTIKAGHANLFLSDVFRDTLAGITNQPIEIYNTDGAIGAARGAGIGTGIYKTQEEAFESLEKIMTVEPQSSKHSEYENAYNNWENELIKLAAK